ncbi:MAG: type II toxin-antitoxin system VapB family antitoxin [Actinomycetota bacterium]|nr:type II toxin-antitoxin system VapB family antitoxin [Actinomycetota bacterium]
MRTTVRLDDALLRAAKRYAAEHGTTLTRVLEDALRALLARRDSPAPQPFLLVTFGQGGLRPGVDLDDSVALTELMERDDPA